LHPFLFFFIDKIDNQISAKTVNVFLFKNNQAKTI